MASGTAPSRLPAKSVLRPELSRLTRRDSARPWKQFIEAAETYERFAKRKDFLSGGEIFHVRLGVRTKWASASADESLAPRPRDQCHYRRPPDCGRADT